MVGSPCSPRTLKSLLQHHSSKASILWRSAFFTVQLSHPYMATGKTIALTRQTFVGKVVSLLFNMLSAAAAAQSLQSCLTLCDPIDGSPLGSTVPGILQARTQVGCHFLLQCMKVKSESEVAQLRPHGLKLTMLLCPWDFPGKSTGVGCHCLLQICYLGWS